MCKEVSVCSTVVIPSGEYGVVLGAVRSWVRGI